MAETEQKRPSPRKGIKYGPYRKRGYRNQPQAVLMICFSEPDREPEAPYSTASGSFCGLPPELANMDLSRKSPKEKKPSYPPGSECWEIRG